MENTPHLVVTKILDSAEFESLIGLEESNIFEAKGKSPYEFDNASGRYELAKDVASFANSNGGYILIGLKTDKLLKRIEKVVSLDLVKKDELEIEKFLGVIKENLYPTIVDLAVSWYASKSDPEMGIVAVYIPSQNQNKKPFLVTRVFEEGEIQKKIIVGIFERSGSDNVPSTAEDIHKIIRRGNDPLLQRTTRIEEKLDLILRKPDGQNISTTSASSVLKKRIGEIKLDY